MICKFTLKLKQGKSRIYYSGWSENVHFFVEAASEIIPFVVEAQEKFEHQFVQLGLGPLVCVVKILAVASGGSIVMDEGRI